MQGEERNFDSTTKDRLSESYMGHITVLYGPYRSVIWAI